MPPSWGSPPPSLLGSLRSRLRMHGTRWWQIQGLESAPVTFVRLTYTNKARFYPVELIRKVKEARAKRVGGQGVYPRKQIQMK
jgi:hypothetical protein